MKSFFKELEINLYNIINDSPLSLEAKYYIMQSVFRQVSDAYLEFLNMAEQEEKIKNDIEDDLDTNSDEDVEGNCYDWYTVNKHNRIIDRTPPLKETEALTLELAADHEERLCMMELGI